MNAQPQLPVILRPSAIMLSIRSNRSLSSRFSMSWAIPSSSARGTDPDNSTLKSTLNDRVTQVNGHFPAESADLNSAGFRCGSVCQSVIVRDVLQPATESMYPVASELGRRLSIIDICHSAL